jgi:DNA-binding CsgD family transcriptional regulator
MLPLDAVRRRRTFDDARADVAIFIRQAELETRSGLALLARRHALTPREAEVLHGIVEIGGIPEVAASLGIGDRTAKAHLQNVFAKTGIKRQADLVRLVAAFSRHL